MPIIWVINVVVGQSRGKDLMETTIQEVRSFTWMKDALSPTIDIYHLDHNDKYDPVTDCWECVNIEN